ncbi:MAG: cobalt ECF transporter T component CbiQ [Anaerolineales bacterium]
MHINTFDHFQRQRPGQDAESLIHRLDPRLKVVVTLLFILSNALLPDGAWLAYLLAWGMVLIFNRLAGLKIRFLITRSFVALPFAMAAITIIFTLPGEPLTAIKIGPWLLVATSSGLVRFASILLRSWISIQTAIVMTATTPFPDLVHALRHLRVPAILVAIISFMYRYLFVLSDEALRLVRARAARSAQPDPVQRKTTATRGGGSVFWRARVAGNMAGQLFLRSYERSDRVYNAMLARGYRGQLLTINPHKMQPKDWITGVIAVILLSLLQGIGWLSV